MLTLLWPGMEADQFAEYCRLLDLPAQLPLTTDAASLFRLFTGHLTTFSYQVSS